jgi:ACS family glucarate transporter-like MFS transporter
MAPESERPTSKRYWVIVFAVALAVVTYIDRVCISQAAPAITHDLRLTPSQMGWVFSAFAWAYALFEIPGGWLGDKIGARKVLMRIVIWWSFFTAATGWAWNVVSLVVTRALFGAGEAGCFPNLTKAFTSWLPGDERVRAQGIMWMSARWGGAFTPLLVVWIFQYMSWRAAFGVFGLLGVIWAIFFYRWYRDSPRDHKGVNRAELALLHETHNLASGHGNVPWRRFLGSRTVWMLWAQYFCLSYGWYFLVANLFAGGSKCHAPKRRVSSCFSPLPGWSRLPFQRDDFSLYRTPDQECGQNTAHDGLHWMHGCVCPAGPFHSCPGAYPSDVRDGDGELL